MIVEEFKYDPEEISSVIRIILEEKELAFVGLSRNPSDFSRNIYEEFKKRNFKLYPVNPLFDELDNTTVYPTVLDIPEK